jgi:hypothetical protein
MTRDESGALTNGEAVPIAEYVRQVRKEERCFSWHDYFNQSEQWRTKDGTWMRIAEMERSHRANVARFLTRNAKRYAYAISLSELFMFHEAPDHVVDSWLVEDEWRLEHPQEWIRGTRLYRAMIAGLAVDGRIDDVMLAMSPRAFTEARGIDERLADVPAATSASNGSYALPDDYDPMGEHAEDLMSTVDDADES